MAKLFRDRADAGQQLAALLGEYAGRSDVIVLALPRGGVPVGAEVARQLGVPLEVFLVRKLGVPGREELAMGALASGGLVVLSEPLLRELGIGAADVAAAIARERRELQRREEAYRGGRLFPDLSGQTVILVDDGLATGSTMRAALAAVGALGPAKVVVAVPVGAPSVCAEFGALAGDVVCARMPEPFRAVGMWYEDFSPTSDEEVQRLLAATE